MTRPIHTALFLALALGCADGKNDLDLDDDGDGVTEFEGDCDDADPDTYPGAATTDSDCVDTDDGATARYGRSCAAYDLSPSMCGLYDQPDFTAMSMCCACSG